MYLPCAPFGICRPPAVSRHRNVLPLKSGAPPPDAAFIAPTASVLGAVTATPSASVWYGATVRGDVAPVSLGERSAVMDGALVGGGSSVGDGAVVGAGSVLGDGAVLGVGAVVGRGAVLGEGVVVEENGVVDAGTFWVGGRCDIAQTRGCPLLSVLDWGAYERVARPLHGSDWSPHPCMYFLRYLLFIDCALPTTPNTLSQVPSCPPTPLFSRARVTRAHLLSCLARFPPPTWTLPPPPRRRR